MSLATTLARWGAFLLRPRRAAAALPISAGRRDGLALLLLYAAGARLLPIGDAVADFWAMFGLAALPTLLAGLAALIPWLVATLAVEAVLGPQRAHRAALCLLPMLLVAALARLLAALGHPLPVPGFAVDVAGAALSVALAAYVRPAVRLSEEPASPAPAGPGPLAVGALALALPLASAALDARDLEVHWRERVPVAAGDPLPDFHASDLAGQDFTSADLRGRAHLLVFWTSWCGVCRREMPDYAALHRELADQRFAVVGINCDDAGDQAAIARRYVDDHDLPFRVVLDRGSLKNAFRVSAYPHLVLVDAHGQIRWVHRGVALGGSLRAAIADALAPAD